jgi:hypothetical protein
MMQEPLIRVERHLRHFCKPLPVRQIVQRFQIQVLDIRIRKLGKEQRWAFRGALCVSLVLALLLKGF